MLYSLDNKTWSANVPTATDAGSYQVWYTVKGDGNHTDSAAKSVQAVIAPQPESQPQPEPAPVPAEPAPAPAPAPVPVDPYGVLIATVISTGDHSLNATWNAVRGADGYDVFFTTCGDYKFKHVATVPAANR